MNLLLGVTGSISVYKSVELLRTFQKNGDKVSIIMTASACRLISPIVFDTFSPGKVHTEMFLENRDPLAHIHLADDNDLMLIAPATANILGKFAGGIADDLLSTTFLAWDKRVVVAPAMNTRMFRHPAVTENLQILEKRGVEILQPAKGSLACSDEGEGRLPPVEEIFRHCLEGDQ